MRQVHQRLQLLAEDVGVPGHALAEQRFDRAAPDGRAQLLIDVQSLPALPGVDHGVGAGRHDPHVFLDPLMTERRLHEVAAATVIGPVAHDQSCRPVNRDEYPEGV